MSEESRALNDRPIRGIIEKVRFLKGTRKILIDRPNTLFSLNDL